jgi:hypothetical protein
MRACFVRVARVRAVLRACGPRASCASCVRPACELCFVRAACVRVQVADGSSAALTAAVADATAEKARCAALQERLLATEAALLKAQAEVEKQTAVRDRAGAQGHPLQCPCPRFPPRMFALLRTHTCVHVVCRPFLRVMCACV